MFDFESKNYTSIKIEINQDVLKKISSKHLVQYKCQKVFKFW